VNKVVAYIGAEGEQAAAPATQQAHNPLPRLRRPPWNPRRRLRPSRRRL
jgi:hypothetical protein